MAELRPCYVINRYPDRLRKALFHRWIEKSELKQFGTELGVHKPLKVVTNTFALVEFEQGELDWIDPGYIVFCDDEFSKYTFKSVEGLTVKE
ncbi:MAG: hypothetical protein IJZ42_01620 [Lachnospiraceae bacterium]|nr:hypothetical protein [Lachnospiraceae bacterium]